MSKSGIVNVRMVITEEKILSNIDKVQKMINPKNKKQIVQLDEDTYFKDLIESIKNYLIEYPKKKNFPASVYKEAYGLVEFAINQFEENTKNVEELIRQRENNINLAGILSELIEKVDEKQDDWEETIEENSDKFPEETIEELKIIAKCKGKTSQRYQENMKLLKAKVNNLESNLHIEIDMERLEDSSKALSYIGIEISDALKLIPTPEENTEKVVEKATNVVEVNEKVADKKEVGKTKHKEIIKEAPKKVKNSLLATSDDEEEISNEKIVADNMEDIETYQEETTMKVKPSLWQKFKNSKLVRAATFIFRVKIRIEIPSNALPEGRGEK